MYDCIIILDVSGSMPDAVIRKVVREASQHSGLLITFNSQVEVINLDTLTAETNLKVGGASEISCVSDYLSSHKVESRRTIVITDGMFDSRNWGDLPDNTEFIIVGEYGQAAPFDKVTYVKDEKEIGLVSNV